MTAAEEKGLPPPFRKFTHRTEELAFSQHQVCGRVYATDVYLLRPPESLPSSSRPWITTFETTADYTDLFRHPLTCKPHSLNLPRNFYILKFDPITLSVYYAFRQPYSADKLLGLPKTFPDDLVERCTFFALYGGGLLQGRPRFIPRRSTPVNGDSPWVKLPHHGSSIKFDDIIDFQDKVYAIDRQGITYLVNHYKTVAKISMGKTLVFEPLTPGSGQFGWRKRFAADEGVLYVVVRTEEKLFLVFRLKSCVKRLGETSYYWDKVKKFEGKKVLFMARDHCFFLKASRKFPGREYNNCIVFSEAAFPQYGNGCWEFTESDNVRRCEDDIAVFRLGDERFAREDEWENSGFPKIDWSPPDWFLNAADEFKKHSKFESSSSQSEREPDDDKGLDSDSGDKNDGEVQEEMETEFNSQDQYQGVVESDSESKDQEDEKSLMTIKDWILTVEIRMMERCNLI